MPIAVLTPCLLEVRGRNEYIHYYGLEQLLKNIKEHTNLRFQYYIKAPYDGFPMAAPIYDSYALNNQVAINVFGQIQKLLLPEFIDLENYPPVILPFCMVNQDNDMTMAFRSYLNFLHGNDGIMFIGEDSFQLHRPIEMYVDGREEDKFDMPASTYVDIELTNVLSPYLKSNHDTDAIFPKADFCGKYNEYVQRIKSIQSMDQYSKNALFETIGDLVAFYNDYEKDNRLSKLNTTKDKKRIVFSKRNGRKYYLSLDLESGGFEVFDRTFAHQGQFDFSGEQVKPASPRDHILKH